MKLFGSILLLLTVAVSVVFSAMIDDDELYNEVWGKMSKGFQKMTSEFEGRCEEKGHYIDSTKMETQLEQCVRPTVKDLIKSFTSNEEQTRQIAYAFHQLQIGTKLNSDQITAIRKGFVEPLCRYMPPVLKCIRPHQHHLIEHCTQDLGPEKKAIEYVTVLVDALCKDNGNNLVDFVAADGVSCSNSIIEVGLDCFKNYYGENFENLEHADDIKTTLELCNKLGIFHNCVGRSLDACPIKEPSKIFHTVLDDVELWLHTSCLKSSATFNSQVSSSLNFIIALLINYFNYRFMFG